MTIRSQAPTRVDLAGGTLDIWPLYLFHRNSQTINFAISCYARCELAPRRDRTIELISEDQKRRESFVSLDALKSAPRYELPLLARLVSAFEPQRGFTLTTSAESPAGAGLGGSSALNIAVSGALARFVRRELSAPELIQVAKNVEAQVLGVPTGEQDYYSAVFGGVLAIQLGPHGIVPRKIAVSRSALNERVVLCYTGESRNSGINNWEVMKAHIDGNPKVVRQFDQIAAVAEAMRRALAAADWKQTADLLNTEWRMRKKNHPGITTPGIERLIRIARRRGAAAAKVCGAGGGGCVMFLVEPAAKSAVESALRAAGARVLPFRIPASGLRVTEQ